MAYLCCTKKIIDLLNITPAPYIPDEDTSILGPWYANLFLVERKKCLIFVNSKTLFSFVTVNQAKKDIKQIGDIFRLNVSARLQAESISHDMIDRIMEDYKTIIICKTSDRKILGSMNELIFHFRVHCEMDEGLANIDMDDINTRIAGTIMRLNNEYIRPREVLKEITNNI